MIHIYCGEGKGKTTAAMGLALRMAGRGRKVVIAQFLKSSDTGERAILSSLPQVTILDAPERIKFVFAMSPAERDAEAAHCRALLARSAEAVRETGASLLVLDEVCGAVETGLLSGEEVCEAVQPLQAEVVLTGRYPHPLWLEQADYVTRMERLRHPYDRGIPAREGVEW